MWWISVHDSKLSINRQFEMVTGPIAHRAILGQTYVLI